ncbi:MAG: glycosyl transferase [Deltaproteobacteria bacterium]|nr:glycosyl transferase [Deltaproteobacteria bacterium]
MHYFTSITANYLPKARVLAKSVKRHNPEAIFHLVLADQMPDHIHPEREPFDSVIFIQDLGIPNVDSWVFKHTVVELCTAVKGAAFHRIAESEDADKVIYFDPDIVVLHGLDELSGILDRSSVVLTPHQVEPDTAREAIVDNEICSLKHGIYNLGFLGIRKSAEGMRFIRWWRDRLLEFCYDDIPGGLFTDQRWVDLAPAFFDDVLILRDKTYNVATWNLTHRDVQLGHDGGLCIDDSPVKFFHFSGFDSGDQEVMLNKYAKKNSPLFDLREWYIGELNREGHKELGGLPCRHSFYSNGEPITDKQRRVYRFRRDLIEAFPNPYRVTGDRRCYYSWFKHQYAGENGLETYSPHPSGRILNGMIRFFHRHPKLKYAVKGVLNTVWNISSKVKKIFVGNQSKNLSP